MKNANFVDRKGEIFITNQGYEVKIIEYFNCFNCTILLDNKIVIKNTIYNHIKKGHINNPYHPALYDIGFIGEGDYTSVVNKVRTKEYKLWASMLKRSYSEKYKEKFPSYIGITVCEEWHNFQNFAKWVSFNYNPETMKDWHLDKDLISEGNKIYSPETCCFVPNKLNCVFTSRVDKKKKFKALNEFRGQIPNNLYECILAEIESND